MIAQTPFRALAGGGDFVLTRDAAVSRRAAAVAATTPVRLLLDYLAAIDYFRRRDEPGVLDFTFGDPREMPAEAYVSALREAVTPRHAGWFAYQQYQPVAQEAAAASLGELTGLAFAPEDMLLTTGGFSALSVGLKLVADPGDEVIYSLPPWFLYEGLAVDAGLVPVKVRVDPVTLDLDLEAIAAAITPRTRIVIVNSPNNPTGRVYPPETLARLADLLREASARNDRRIFILSDEPYNRIVFSGNRFRTPAEFYPDTLIAYSYGKTLLAPGYASPTAVMQYALPALERLSIDLVRLERRRDFMVDALTAMGYRVHRPEGTFYLFPHSPIADDEAFARDLAATGILVMPGALFETPGFFRICLTASDEMCERALPGFAAALRG
jgi:aspartate aminotransferase